MKQSDRFLFRDARARRDEPGQRALLVRRLLWTDMPCHLVTLGDVGIVEVVGCLVCWLAMRSDGLGQQA